ncbi:MAG: TetR/AcrR family transcriptional regulator [Proteobacteria bacterium]|nr:TetR/AcrR family transcriptional regulator [Pseudomonadota bacterium]
MARRATIDDARLLEKLGCVFRECGYEGASLAVLAKAAGLQKASLYHRFPGGKEQMAREVLAAAEALIARDILMPLKSKAPPAERVDILVRQLNGFYSAGRQACLLNMLSAAPTQEGPFAKEIKRAFAAIIAALAVALRDAGFDARSARVRSERAVMLLQGSLVLCRGMGTTRPFRDFLKRLPQELLAGRA